MGLLSYDGRERTRKEMEDQLSFQQQLNILVLVVLQIEWKR